MTPVIEIGLPFDDYRQRDGLNASILKACRTSMLHGRLRATEGWRETPPMRWGRLMHAAVLEPGVLMRHMAVWEGPVRRGKAYDEFATEHDERYIVAGHEAEALGTIIDRVQRDRMASDLLARCDHEVSVFWEGDGYGRAKARPDGLKGGLAVEYKTTSDIRVHRFTNTAEGMGYRVQAGWLSEGLGTTAVEVYYIVQEQKPPYALGVYRPTPAYMEKGREDACRLARQYRECEAADVWPGPLVGVQTLDLPVWAGGAGECSEAWEVEGDKGEA